MDRKTMTCKRESAIERRLPEHLQAELLRRGDIILRTLKIFSCTRLLPEPTHIFPGLVTVLSLQHVGRAPSVAHSLLMYTATDPGGVADIETAHIPSIHSKTSAWTRSRDLIPGAEYEQRLRDWEISKISSARSADILNIRYRQAWASYTSEARGRVSVSCWA